MRELAEFCDVNNYPDDALRIRQLAAAIDQQTLNVDDLPADVQPTASPSLPAVEREWRARLGTLQGDYAQDLYRLSRLALKDGHASYAFHLVREVAFQDPDHKQARGLLGYVRYEDGWTTPFAAAMLRKGYEWHATFGWLPRTHVERYEQGERFYNGKWISADKEAAVRSDFRHAWQVLTEHFAIHTNHSLERGVELGVALEDFYAFFLRNFAAFFNTRQQMEKLFDSGSASTRGAARRHVIHYYRSREEFITRLKSKQPDVAIGNGLYLPADRTAYFFHDPDNPEWNIQTMYHEVTHQILGESSRAIADVGQDAHFWLVEGLACYMESFRREDGRMSVGDPHHVRIGSARRYCLDEDFYLPLATFTSLGMREFQTAGALPTLQRYYSQATGLTHFFLHHQDGAYRDDLIEHLSQIYSPGGRVRVQSLDALTGVPFPDLDRQYKDYLRSLAPPADELPPSEESR